MGGAAQSDKIYVPSPPRNVHLHDPTFSVAMAVGPDVNNKNLEELEREITCAVCHKHYQEAKLLPCNHYYCGACIETLAKRSLERPFLCPECRKDTSLPPGGVEQLQSAFFVERMKDVYGKMAKVAARVEATCECCSEGKVVAFCRQCTDFICAECVTQHQKMKPFTGHKVTTLDDLNEGGTETLPLKETLFPKCEEHDEQMKISTIQAELKSLVNPATSVRVNVVKKGYGIYHITYIPRVRGRHDLVVKVDGKYIPGSPFRVFVKIHPTQLGSPVRTITGVNQPWGIAINDKQQLVVAECGRKTITIRERDGKRLQNIGQFTTVCGVATGPDGAIYTTDIGTECVQKFDSNGQLIKTIKNDFNCPSFIKYINNRLYISNRGSNEITILDTDCNIIGTMRTLECPKPCDIAEGDDGLYVVGGGGEKKEEYEDDEWEEEEEEDKGKISVYTCVPNGEFIRHINIRLSSANLFNPFGICFGPCNEHIFVTGCGVYVFKPDGKRVATFGKNMYSSSGIAIDEDGFVYVCDYGVSKKNILVF